MTPRRKDRKILRRLASLAYERELGEALGELDAAFLEWRGGVIDAFQLNDAVHRHHQGPLLDLWKRYQCADAEITVTLALARGVLTEDDIPQGSLGSVIEKAGLIRQSFAARDADHD